MSKEQPSGKERMKRKAPAALSLRPQQFESDPKKAYTAEQLAEIGAIALKWNQIEAHIDFIGTHILFQKAPFWLKFEMENRLSSMAKLELLKECLSRSNLTDDKIKGRVLDCFSQVHECRQYRNGIIHHHIYDHAQGIGSYVSRSSGYQILITLDALATLYKILCCLLDEVREIDLLFRIETDAQRPGRLDEETGKFEPFSEDDLRTRAIPEIATQIEKLQQVRKKLPHLPQFPDADLVRSLQEQDDAKAAGTRTEPSRT